MICRFCKKHFYDSQEIYLHMEQNHFKCHICRQEHPDRHDYFNQYEQLEAHFEAKHYPCPFERCREDKFVVFATESELKRHMAQQHGDELQMKKHERRAAMTVETGFAYDVPRVSTLHTP
jgi:E3 ubiquitin-protein ligase ZNF598